MSKTSRGISRNPGKSLADPAGHDDMSDVTVNNGKAANENDAHKHIFAPSIIHTHWMQSVQLAFGSEVIIVNNQNQKLEKMIR